MIENLMLDGPHGILPVRIHRPESSAGVGLVWAHGGAFAGGDLDMPESEQVARELARGGVTVVAIDYQLAPLPPSWADELGVPIRSGVHAPIPEEEVAWAWQWARDADSTVPSARWSIGGASAGASLAASAALQLRAEDVRPRSLLLAYPTLHAALPDPSAELAVKTRSIPAARRFPQDRVLMMNQNHLGLPLDRDHPSVFAGGQKLSGLPPVLIINSEYDDLRASGEQFAVELSAAGVRCSCVLEPRTFHGHLNDHGEEAALRTIERMRSWLLDRRGDNPSRVNEW